MAVSKVKQVPQLDKEVFLNFGVLPMTSPSFHHIAVKNVQLFAIYIFQFEDLQ